MSRLLSLLVCLVGLGLPRVGLAAADVPLAPLPRLALSGPLAWPEAPTDPSVDGPRESFRPPRALRVLAEVGAGLITSAGSGILGGVLGYGLCETVGWGAHDKFRCLAPIVFMGLLGLTEGYGLGVWWGGEAMRGDGSLALTLLGATAGALGGYALVQSGNPELGYSLAVLPILLSHLGYELFQREPPGIQPLVSVSARGTVLGVGGRF